MALSACAGGASQTGIPQIRQSIRTSIAQRNGWTPMFTTYRSNVDDAFLHTSAGHASTIPYFTRSIKSPLDGKTYSYDIAGTDPHDAKVTTDLYYVPIVLVFTFPGGAVLDPTKPGCGDTVSVQDRFFDGPNFVSTPLVSNGISVGTTQINDGDQRAQWWTLVHGSGYHLLLKMAAKPIVVTMNAPTGSTTSPGDCSGANHDLGMINYSAYKGIIVTLGQKYTTLTQIPLILTYNVVQTTGSGGCCIIGFHGAFGRSGGTEVYATAAYTDPNEFGEIQDIHAWTHEIGEMMNDPFLDNLTPAWGHVGQVSGCQNNLEVGDPLTGTPFLVNFRGFTYHPQELAFFDWFFRTKSEGTGGAYSFEGTFKTVQGACT